MEHVYNKKCDLYPVDQVGFLDLRSAFVNGVVDGNFSISDESYNAASPADLMHRPLDNFDAMRQADMIKSSMAAQSETEAVTE